MTVRGHFDQFGRPTLRCVVFVPRLRTDLVVEFLVDTGADRSVLMPKASIQLGLHEPDAEQHLLGTGFGGIAVGTRETVSIDIDEAQFGKYRFLVAVDVPRGNFVLPSVLGRDILDRCRLVHDPTNDLLELDVWQCDSFVPR